MKLGDTLVDTEGRVLLVVKPIKTGYCTGCAFKADECNVECDGEDLIFIEYNKTGIARYMASRLES